MVDFNVSEPQIYEVVPKIWPGLAQNLDPASCKPELTLNIKP